MVAMAEDSRARVLVPAVLARLEATATVLPVGPGRSFFDDPDVRAALPEVDVLLTGWGCPRISPEVLDAAPKLQAILHAAGSVKAIVDPAAFDRGIQVSSAVVANALPVAEFTVAAIVLAGKRAFRLAAQYRTERRKADPHGMPGSYGTDNDELFSRSDILSVHAPLLPETVGLVDARLLGLLKDGSVLINTSRGKIVDAAALERECVAGRIDAVLDVTDPEPLPPDSPLLDLPNVFVTPHVAGAVGSEIARLGELAVSELERLAAGQPLQHAISPAEIGRIA